MFRKKCNKCNNKLSSKHRFCPNCGLPVHLRDNDKQNYGILGKDDSEQAPDPFQQLGIGGLGAMGSGMLNKMLSSAAKMLEKELSKELKNTSNSTPKLPKTHMQLYINGKKVNLNQHQPNSRKQIKQKQTTDQQLKLPMPNEHLILSSKNIPRIKPKTKMQRHGTKIIYELDMPNTSSESQLLINKLEDSYDIRAYTKKQVWQKTLPIKLALMAYYLKKQKLYLEFKGK